MEDISEETTGGESEVLDAVVVLGAAVWQGGLPSPSLLRRTLHGVTLLLSGQARVLIVSGGLGRFPPSEAAVMRRIAVERGVPDHRIVMDEKSNNTLESARFCSEIMRANQWRSAWIVSDHYHLLRAVILFRRFGIFVKASAPDLHGSGTSRVRWYYLHIRELLALPWNLLKVYYAEGRKYWS